MALAQAQRTQQLSRRLAARQAELQALLAPPRTGLAAGEDRGHEVLDFKDVAADDWRAKIDDAARGQALREMASIAAAVRRLRDGSYGLCEDCGEPIEEQRLLALPAAAYCACCQAIHERAMRPALGRHANGAGR